MVCRCSPKWPPKQVFLKVSQTLQESDCVGVSLKNLQADGLLLYLRRFKYRCIPAKFAKFLRTPLFYGMSLVTASAPLAAAFVFLKNSNSNYTAI